MLAKTLQDTLASCSIGVRMFDRTEGSMAEVCYIFCFTQTADEVDVRKAARRGRVLRISVSFIASPAKIITEVARPRQQIGPALNTNKSTSDYN